MPHERLKPSFVFDEERLKQLKQVTPEAFVDGKINWDVLKEALGEYIEDESQEAEHFGLFWPGKREARKLASIPSKGTLVPIKGEGIDEEKTRNIFIEGENLEVLKLLQKSYVGKIKMIYIDPPYNTGNDFIYDDNFTEPLEEYLKYTGQMDEEGRVLTTNTKADGRFHSKWLSMMYPRLRLARNLLRNDGVIFVSIDSRELNNLVCLMNEIFGEESFLEIFNWVKTETPPNLSLKSKQIIEYVVCFQKSNNQDRFQGIKKTSPSPNGLLNQSNPIGTLVFPKNIVKTSIQNKILKRGHYGTTSYDVELLEDTEVKNGVFVKPVILKAKFKWGQQKLEEEISKDTEIRIPTEKFSPSYEKTEYAPEVPPNLIDSKVDVDTNEIAGTELEGLFKKKVFDYPKPPSLITYLIGFSKHEDNDLVLDFFAGSGTTGHAVFLYNLMRKENRSFILVQLPEKVDAEEEVGKNAISMGMHTISDIAKERLRRISLKLKKESKELVNDIGFRVLKLEKSNFKQWQDYQGKDLKELQQVFEHWQSPLIDGWKEEGLLIEILLQEGFPLDSKIEQLGQYSKNKILQVSSEFCEHNLLICLDKKVYQETINDLTLGPDDRFICLDSALNDEQKVRLSDKGFLKTI